MNAPGTQRSVHPVSADARRATASGCSVAAGFMFGTRGLLQLPPAFNPPGLLDHVASDSVHVFVQIHSYTNVIGDNPNASANIKLMAGFM